MRSTQPLAAALAATLITMLAPTNAVGQILAGKKCATIEENAERLACFDTVFSGANSSPNESSVEIPSAPSQWRKRVDTSPIDDSKNVFLQVESDEPVINQYRQEASLVLTLACRENTTSLWISWGGYFMSSHAGKGRVTYRLDKQPAQTKSFTESNNNKALGLWSGGSAIPFIKSMFGADKLFVEAQPFSDSNVRGFFTVAGLEQDVQELREACHW